MKEYSIHRFSKKLLQQSLFPRLKEYLLKRDSDLAPISINLDLTSSCSYRCPHCIDGSVLNTGKMLDFQYIKDLLRQWKERGLKSVIVIGGGEPTLHPHFEEVMNFLKKELKLPVGLVSNGSQMQKIRKVCPLLEKKDWLRLSVDAGTNPTFQKIHHPRLKVTLEEILSEVKQIRKENPLLQLGYSFLIIGDDKYVGGVPLLSNIKEISLAAKLAKEAGFSYFSLKPVISPEGSRETTISEKNLREIKEEIEKAKALEDENFKVKESINLLCFYNEDLKRTMQHQPRTCHIQFFRAVVNPEGVFTCSSWRGFENLKITDANQKVNEEYHRKFCQRRKKIINSFNAKEICQDINCYYVPFNCWVKDYITSPEKLKKLSPIKDFGDYFF